MMRDIRPLFEKKLVLWGMGKKGCEILTNILSMGAGKKGILLCDSDCNLQGKSILNKTILSPKELNEKIQDNVRNDIVILVTVMSIKAQNEIISTIEKIFGKEVDIYTEYAIEWGIYLGLKNSNVDRRFKEKEIAKHEKNKLYDKEYMQLRWEALKYFSFLPLHNNEIILVYQPGKVASSTIYRSILNRGRHVLHCHVLDGIGENDDSVYQLLNLKAAKIVSVVRDPIERRISEMWQNIHQLHRYSAEVDFAEIERYYFPDDFDEKAFSWFDGQIRKVLKINVFDYPFDTDKGYSIIKKDNIEILLLKMEKLNELEKVIGEFLNIEQFRLDNKNVSSEKIYRFAYRDYKRNFVISEEMLDNVYIKNERMKHFYSRQEREVLYNRWKNERKR